MYHRILVPVENSSYDERILDHVRQLAQYCGASIVQTRRYELTSEGKREAVRYAFLDSTIALSFALFINAAILIVAAATFHRTGNTQVAEIQDAYQLLTPLLGVGAASVVFALALLASGQNSTLTGTLAGQIVMEGFLNIRIRPWLRRLITRGIAIVPAAIVAILYGQSGTAKLLVLSQVVLSLQLSFAVFPLVMFTSSKLKMGEFVNPAWMKVLAYLVATVGACFLFELIVSRPELAGVMNGFIPSVSILQDPDKLYIAIGILGATVMPHNLYLHSSIVQTRKYDLSHDGKREAVRFAFVDSTIALSFALFINAAILIVAAATFHRTGNTQVAEIQDAYQLLTPLLGVGAASVVFALALLASGQNSTLTGTLAGQIVMEGFLNIRIRPWLRRLITRAIAIVPAAIVAILYGQSGTAKLLVLSQVVLSLQLAFAVFPLVMFTSDRAKMGEFANSTWLKALAYLVAFVIAALNTWLLIKTFRQWLA